MDVGFCMNHNKKTVNLLVYWLTNSTASDGDVELYYRNLLPPFVLPLSSSLLTICTQHVHTSRDGFLWRLPVIALHCENETNEWEGVEWIRLDRRGWLDKWEGCLLLSASFVFDSLMVHISHY